MWLPILCTASVLKNCDLCMKLRRKAPPHPILQEMWEFRKGVWQVSTLHLAWHKKSDFFLVLLDYSGLNFKLQFTAIPALSLLFILEAIVNLKWFFTLIIWANVSCACASYSTLKHLISEVLDERIWIYKGLLYVPDKQRRDLPNMQWEF